MAPEVAVWPKPERQLDPRTDQIVLGRARMLVGLDQIERHVAEVTALEGRQAPLADSSAFGVDLVQSGTGYRTDLGYFANPNLAEITSFDE